MATDDAETRTSRRGFLRSSAGMSLAAFVALPTMDAVVSAVTDRLGERTLGRQLAETLRTTEAARSESVCEA